MRNQDENVTLVEEDLRAQPWAKLPSKLVDALIQKKRTVVGVAVAVFVIFVLMRTASSSGETDEIQKTPSKQPEDLNDSSEGIFDIDDFLEHREDYSQNCSKSEFNMLEPGSHDYLVKEADCGAGYVFDDEKRHDTKPARVVLFGQGLKDNFALSGCPLGAQRCFHHPKCVFSLTSSVHDEVLSLADVIVTTNMDASQIDVISARSKKSKVRRILYWREAYWPYVSTAAQRKQFDLQMGVHYTSGIVNPNYLRKPRTLIAKSFFEFLPFKERDNFALSIISNCHANSQRNNYIQFLTDFLGPERVHQYGLCGNRKLPPPPIKNAAKVIAKYKFYLSFENSIQSGYVSEKLFTVMNMQLLPVYLGALNVPNITTIPSFIKVQDYKSPKHLAEYLLYLDSNSEAYNRYHLWRKDTSLFTKEYLELIKTKFPSPMEMKPYGKAKFALRTAGCCRLCNLPFLDDQIAQRKDDDLIEHPLGPEMINKIFFDGKLHKRPGPKARLDGKVNDNQAGDGDTLR